MSPPANGRGAAGTHSDGPTYLPNNAPSDQPGRQADHSGRPPSAVVTGTRLRAAGRARIDRVLVARCSLCGFPHLHVVRDTTALAVERAPSCAPRRTYLVQILDVVPAADTRRAGAWSA